MAKSIPLEDDTIADIRTEQLNRQDDVSFDFVSGEPEVQTVGLLLPAVQAAREAARSDSPKSAEGATEWISDAPVVDISVMEDWVL